MTSSKGSCSFSCRFCTPMTTSPRSEEHTSELQSRLHLVCRLLLEKKNLAVDENVSTSRDLRYQNLQSDRISLSVGGSGLSDDLAIVARSRVHGNVTLSGSAVSTALRFLGPEERTTAATTSGYEVYLIPGTYVVSANETISSRDVAFVSTATVPHPANLSFAFTNATRATGHAVFQGVAVPGPMPVSFVRREGGGFTVSTDGAGAYSVILAPGNYSVTVGGVATATEGGVTRFYRYAFAGNTSVASGQTVLSYDLVTSRTFDNTTVAGSATLSGQAAAASITFTARGGGAITTQANADTPGLFSVPLPAGTYDVDAAAPFGPGSFPA